MASTVDGNSAISLSDDEIHAMEVGKNIQFWYQDKIVATGKRGFKLLDCKDDLPKLSIETLSKGCDWLVKNQKISKDPASRRIIAYVIEEGEFNQIRDSLRAAAAEAERQVAMRDEEERVAKENAMQERKAAVAAKGKAKAANSDDGHAATKNKKPRTSSAQSSNAGVTLERWFSTVPSDSSCRSKLNSLSQPDASIKSVGAVSGLGLTDSVFIDSERSMLSNARAKPAATSGQMTIHELNAAVGNIDEDESRSGMPSSQLCTWVSEGSTTAVESTRPEETENHSPARTNMGVSSAAAGSFAASQSRPAMASKANSGFGSSSSSSSSSSSAFPPSSPPADMKQQNQQQAFEAVKRERLEQLANRVAEWISGAFAQGDGEADEAEVVRSVLLAQQQEQAEAQDMQDGAGAVCLTADDVSAAIRRLESENKVMVSDGVIYEV